MLADELIRDFFGHLPLVAPGPRNRLDDIISGDHRGWFPPVLAAKDVRLAEELARSHGRHLPLDETVKRRYEQASADCADADITGC